MRLPVVDEFITAARPQGVVLDAGVAVLYYLGSFDRSLVGRAKRTEIFAPEDYATLLRLLAFFNRVVTTPHVLTEVCNLLGHMREPKRTGFFINLRNQLAKAEERHMAAALLAEEVFFPRLELTDTALVHLARTGLGIITIDSGLHNELLREGSAALNFNHIRTLVWS
jgi:hypothetical protein